MSRTNPILLVGKKAYYKTEDETTKCGVVAEHTPAINGLIKDHDFAPETVIVNVDGGFVMLDRRDAVIQLEGNDIPEVWKKILEENAEIGKVGVCLLAGQTTNSTTLFHRETLETLISSTTEINVADVSTWRLNGRPREGKSEQTDWATRYLVGEIEVDMEIGH